MKYEDVFEIVKTLEFDTEKPICTESGIKLYILRPSKVSKRFKNYDINKNFQIWLDEGNERPFRPNHLRVMIDLNLRARSRPELKKDLLLAFDKIFYHEDPDEVIKNLAKEHFEHFLDPLKVIANLSQLFIIEQEYCYNKPSNYIPPTLFYQGWVRAFIDNRKQIDDMSLSVGKLQPPPRQYTEKENANPRNKKYDPNFRSKMLWYLEN